MAKEAEDGARLTIIGAECTLCHTGVLRMKPQHTNRFIREHHNAPHVLWFDVEIAMGGEIHMGILRVYGKRKRETGKL